MVCMRGRITRKRAGRQARPVNENLWNDFRQTCVSPSVGFESINGADVRSSILHSGAGGQNGIVEGE
jgi:hypothetical protein